MITRVASITLEVPDLRASLEFFESKVGLTLTEQIGPGAYMRATANHHDLVLIQSDQGRCGLRTLNLEVGEGGLWNHTVCVRQSMWKRLLAAAIIQTSLRGAARNSKYFRVDRNWPASEGDFGQPLTEKRA